MSITSERLEDDLAFLERVKFIVNDFIEIDFTRDEGARNTQQRNIRVNPFPIAEPGRIYRRINEI